MTDHPRIPLAGVIGHPIAHSRSPALHSYWRIEPGRPIRLLGLVQAPFQDRSEDGRDAAAADPLAITRELERLYRDAPASISLRS